MVAERQVRVGLAYRRDGFTWVAFAALMTFGVLNAVLGPALPYLRAVEHISYLVGALHQVAFAVGGGLAGLAASHARRDRGRPAVIRLGLAGAAAAGLALGYGDTAIITILAALLVSLLGTSALVRLWAALADAHGTRRTVAMTEGKVSVSLGGIIAPLLVGGLAVSRLARHTTTVCLLAGAITTGLIGLPILLAATNPVVAGVGLALAGAGIGATFPLASSLHVASTSGTADDAVGQVIAVAAIGQILGPVAVAVIAQAAVGCVSGCSSFPHWP